MVALRYYCYILQSERDGRYYVGSTNDLTDRVTRHNEGRVRSTKGRGPWVLVHSEQFRTRSEAIRREREIKKRRKRSLLEQLVEKGVV